MTDPAAMQARLRALIPLLLLLAMIGPLTLNILQPALPGLASTLKTPRETVQLTLSLYILGMAFAQLIAGPLADRYGRRPVVLTGLVIFILASSAAALAQTINTLIIARDMQALGATACLALSRAIIGDLSDRSTTARILAYVTMVMVLAPMAAPNVGAALDAYFGWQSIFVFCAIFGVLSVIVVAVFLFETRPVAMHSATFRDVAHRTWRLASNIRFLRYAGTSSFASACFFIFLGASPHLVIENMGRSPAEFGAWYILLGIGYSLGNFTVARATHLFGIERMMRFGNILVLVSAGSIALMSLVPIMHPAAVFCPAALFTYGNGLVMPHSMAGGIQTDRNAAGAASGLIGFAQMLTGALFSYVVVRVSGETPLVMALMMMTCGLVSLLMIPPRQETPAA